MLCQVVLVSRATPANVSTPCRRAGTRLNAQHEPLACDLQARTAAPGPQVRQGMPVRGKRAKSHETPFVPNEVTGTGPHLRARRLGRPKLEQEAWQGQEPQPQRRFKGRRVAKRIEMLLSTSGGARDQHMRRSRWLGSVGRTIANADKQAMQWCLLVDATGSRASYATSAWRVVHGPKRSVSHRARPLSICDLARTCTRLIVSGRCHGAARSRRSVVARTRWSCSTPTALWRGPRPRKHRGPAHLKSGVVA